MDVNTDKHSRYQITRPQHMLFVREYLNDQSIGLKDAIIDIGCGKGGMLIIFSEYPFSKIAGLEFFSELCRIANDNMHALDIASASIINDDANCYDQYDEYNYFYMYNPFGEEIMTRVIENILASVKRTPRTIHIIYANPAHGRLFIKNGFVIEKKFKKSLWFSDKAIIYKYDIARGR